MISSISTHCVLWSCWNFIGFEFIQSFSIVLTDWIIRHLVELNRFVIFLVLLLKWCNCVVFEESAHISLVVLWVTQLFFLVGWETFVGLIVFFEKLASSFELLVEIVSGLRRDITIVKSIIRTSKVSQERVTHHFSVKGTCQWRIPINVE